jgi:thiol:disulfide interchange protein
MGLAGSCAAAQGKSGPAWKTSYVEALNLAVKDKKLIVLDLYADWCGPCKMMDRDTYSDKRVIKALERYVALKIDVDKSVELGEKYKVVYLPTTLVLDAKGKVIHKTEGFLDSKDFLAMLKQVEKAQEKKRQKQNSIPEFEGRADGRASHRQSGGV